MYCIAMYLDIIDYDPLLRPHNGSKGQIPQHLERMEVFPTILKQQSKQGVRREALVERKEALPETQNTHQAHVTPPP